MEKRLHIKRISVSQYVSARYAHEVGLPRREVNAGGTADMDIRPGIHCIPGLFIYKIRKKDPEYRQDGKKSH